MQEQEERIKVLILKYLDKSLTDEENQELNEFGSGHPQIWLLIAQLEDDESLALELRAQESADTQHALADVWTNITYRETKRVHKTAIRKGLSVAAGVLLLAGGFWLWRLKQPDKDQSPATPALTGVSPGNYKAVLTLADGSSMRLDKQPAGILTRVGDMRISKQDSNCLIYTAEGNSPGQYNYNTLATPRAGQFQVILTDGTKVWLNNASSLHYPTAFTGKTREVSLTGEGYFEVAPDLARPFIVKIKNLQVDVLGTHFNITGYDDEKEISTTLINGKVKLSSGDGSRSHVLKPGQQAVFDSVRKDFQVREVDTSDAMAWKDGYFHFHHADLPYVLRQLARWYDVDVEVRGTLAEHFYEGDLHRNSPLDAILKDLTVKNIHFIVEGKKLIVSR